MDNRLGLKLRALWRRSTLRQGRPRSLGVTPLLTASIALLLAMSGAALWNLHMQRIDGEWVAHSNRVRYELLQILQLLTAADGGVREFSLTGSERALQAYHDASRLIEPAIQHVADLTSDNPRQRPQAAQLAAIARDLEADSELLLTAARSGNTAQVRSLLTDGHLDAALLRAQPVMAQMQAEEDHLVIERRIARDRARRDAALALWATGLIGSLLLVLIVYFTRRDEANLHRVERELATSLRSIGDAVIATDVSGNIRFMNPVAVTLTGADESRARGQPLAHVFKIINEESRKPVDCPSTHVLTRGETVQLDEHTLLIARDGSERAIAGSGAPILDETGKVQGMVLVFRDVSKDRRAERTLKLRDAELQVINEYARFPVARCDPQHRFLFVNKAYAERLGFTPEQCVGKHIAEIVGEQAYERILPYAEKALAGHLIEFEAEIPYAGIRGARWMRCIYSPVRDDAGHVTSFVAAVTDITERKQAELELQRSQAALEETDRRKDEFIATLSHELRNPLAPIRTAAKLLVSPGVKPTQLERAQMIIERQVTHMALLLDDLLDIARITQGKLQLKKESVALVEVVDAALEAARPIVEAKNHQLSVTLPVEPITLEADPVRLSQILTNLVTNAAKYSDPGGRIGVAATVQRDTLSFSVKDDGIGIAAEDLTGIFNMFSQVEGVLGRSDGGLGIGLALVKGLTELHGGSVHVQSEGLGRGSEFIVRLPIGALASSSISDGRSRNTGMRVS